MQLALPPADQRIAEILGLVRVAFAEKGFDGASMQDLARAAGMSVGNFYRYFPSKSDIVAQLIAHDLQEMQRDFAAAISSDRPMDSLRRLIHARIDDCCSGHEGQLWAEISAAALRKPEIGSVACQMEGVVNGYMTQIFAAETGLTPEEAAVRFAPNAAFIVLLVKSAGMIGPQFNTNRNHLNTLILRTIDRELDEIASTGSKG